MLDMFLRQSSSAPSTCSLIAQTMCNLLSCKHGNSMPRTSLIYKMEYLLLHGKNVKDSATRVGPSAYQWQLWHLRPWLRIAHMRRSSSLPPVPNSQPIPPIQPRPPPSHTYLRYAHSPPSLRQHPPFFYNATMISSGFTNAPVTQFLVFGTVIGALLAAITDSRFYLHIQVVPHLWQYGQFWRCGVWTVCFILFVERWGGMDGNGVEAGKRGKMGMRKGKC